MPEKQKFHLWSGSLNKWAFFLLIIPLWILTLGIFEIGIKLKNHRIVLPMNPLWGKLAAIVLKRIGWKETTP